MFGVDSSVLKRRTRDGENAFGGFPNHWRKIFAASPLGDVTNADMNKALRDIMAGTTRATLKTKNLRCKAIVRFDIR